VSDLIARFFIGGVVVSIFALISDLLKPKSFAGLFGAAPSIAIATLALTIAKQGSDYAAIECRSMLAGAIALGIYSCFVSWLLIRRPVVPLSATLFSMIVWFAGAFGLWLTFLR
jgi:hypothetical protein